MAFAGSHSCSSLQLPAAQAAASSLHSSAESWHRTAASGATKVADGCRCPPHSACLTLGISSALVASWLRRFVAATLRLPRGDTPGCPSGTGTAREGRSRSRAILLPAAPLAAAEETRGALERSVNQRRHFSRSAAWLGCLRLTLFFFCDLITLDWCLCWSF